MIQGISKRKTYLSKKGELTMIRRIVCLLLLAALLLAPAALAQSEENPTIAAIYYGPGPTSAWIGGGVWSALHSYGHLTDEDFLSIENPHGVPPLQGEHINIMPFHADFDIANVNLIVEQAIDDGADILITVSTLATQGALQVTQDMEDPPAIFFADVHDPYAAGIAQSSCIKPAHVTGSITAQPYAEILALLRVQDPDIQTIGTIHNSNSASGLHGVEQIKEVAEAMGLTVESVAITSFADLNAATSSLFNKGVEALVLPDDDSTAQGLPIIAQTASEAGIPVFQTSVGSVVFGATFGAGMYLYFDQGLDIGLRLAHYLSGDLDIASTAISQRSHTDIAVGLNTGMAALQGIEFSEELMAMIDVVVDAENNIELTSEMAESEFNRVGAPVALEDDRVAADQEFLASLHCTEEMIAEQQAELDAASG